MKKLIEAANNYTCTPPYTLESGLKLLDTAYSSASYSVQCHIMRPGMADNSDTSDTSNLRVCEGKLPLLHKLSYMIELHSKAKTGRVINNGEASREKMCNILNSQIRC